MKSPWRYLVHNTQEKCLPGIESVKRIYTTE